jgi:hypothetical protein
LPLVFESEKGARDFVARHKHVCYLCRPFDTGRHVYSNWEPILKQTMHHPKWNPWRMARRKIRHTATGCPQTLDVLKRTVRLNVPFDRTVPQVRALARKMIG